MFNDGSVQSHSIECPGPATTGTALLKGHELIALLACRFQNLYKYCMKEDSAWTSEYMGSSRHSGSSILASFYVPVLELWT